MSAQLGKTVAVVALVVGPLTLIAANIIQWTLHPSGASPTATDVAAQFPTVWLTVGLLSVFGPMIWLAGLPRITALAGRRGALTTKVGVLLTGLGFAAAIGHLAVFFGLYSAIARSGLDATATQQMESAADKEPLGTILLAVFLVCYSLGPIILTVGLRMAHRVGVWVPIAAIITAAANLFGGPVTGVIQLAALAGVWGAIAVAVARADAAAPVRHLAHV